MPASRLKQEGRIAIVTKREAGMRWTLAGLVTNGARADERNRVVLIPRRWDQARGLAMSAFGPTRRDPASDGG